MDTVGNVGGTGETVLIQSTPEPESSSSFEAIRSAVRGVTDSALSLIQTASSPLIGASGLGGDVQGLLMLQLEVQREMMTVSMISNVEKSKHESQMAAVRNIRVS